MSQTSYIAAAIIVGFIVFITMKGELDKYISVFSGSSANPQEAAAPANPFDSFNIFGNLGSLMNPSTNTEAVPGNPGNPNK